MDEIKHQFNEILKEHGYGFQYSVLRLVHNLSEQKASPWIFEGAEFPVEVQGVPTRIDFILKLKNRRIFMVAECKRANPKFNNWCFVKAPYVRRNRSSEHCFVDHVEYDRLNGMCRVSHKELSVYVQERAYHIGLVVKSKEKGEGSKSEKDVIEQAATQVCRGVNGLIDLANKKPDLILSGAQNDPGTKFIPVIFTTAKIYVCDCDLASANIENGNLDISNQKMSEKNFIYYQYHLSPGIKHSDSVSQTPNQFYDILDYEYVRTIPIVTATGITDFLCSFCTDEAKWSTG